MEAVLFWFVVMVVVGGVVAVASARQVLGLLESCRDPSWGSRLWQKYPNPFIPDLKSKTLDAEPGNAESQKHPLNPEPASHNNDDPKPFPPTPGRLSCRSWRLCYQTVNNKPGTASEVLGGRL